MEPRKIVLILGNGFDIDFGLKTTYKDFWESEFCPKGYPSPLIRHLNSRWKTGIDSVRWYDLENELSVYGMKDNHSDIISEHDRQYLISHSVYQLNIKETYYNETDPTFERLVDKGIIIRENLITRSVSVPYYDDLLESYIWRDKKALRLIKEGLCYYLTSAIKDGFNSNSIALNALLSVECARKSDNFLDIFTFNYTPIPVDYGEGFKDSVHYVHGNCESGRIVIGTGDKELDENYDFLQKSFDPYFNPPELVTALLEADDIIIFGHSLGENDRQYFKPFFKRQTDPSHPASKRIIIFTRDETSEVQIKRSLQKMTDNNLSALCSMNRVDIIKTSTLKEHPEVFRDFLERYIEDKMQIEVTMNQLFG